VFTSTEKIFFFLSRYVACPLFGLEELRESVLAAGQLDVGGGTAEYQPPGLPPDAFM